MSNVSKLAERAGNGKMQTPEMVFNECLEDIGKEGALTKGKKCIVIALNDTEGDYDVTWYQAGLSASECVVLCEVAKMRFLKQMGYALGEHDLVEI